MRRGELFLSHATPDRKFVERLTKRLDGEGFRYFYSRRHIAGARQWHDELGEALRRCNWFVLILTKSSVKSVWVKRELIFALDSSAYRERIVPLLLEACPFNKLSWTLDGFQLVDFKSGFEQGFAALMRALKPKRAAAARPRQKATRSRRKKPKPSKVRARGRSSGRSKAPS